MRKPFSIILLTAPLLAACTLPGNQAAPAEEPVVPETVLQLAAQNPNAYTARLQPDGCYWYQHAGPVETTLLPLVTPAGQRICNPSGAGETVPGYAS